MAVWWRRVERGGRAGFDFQTAGLRLALDAADSPVATAGAPLKAAFGVCNTGKAAGSCMVTIYVDGAEVGVSWNSPQLEPGQCAGPDEDGYVHGIPAQSEGDHTFEAITNPAGPRGGSSGVNTVSIGAAG